MYSVYDTCLMAGGFPHSEISGSKLIYQLPEAYRRLTRPSSPPTAKASTVCAWSLDYITRSIRFRSSTGHIYDRYLFASALEYFA
jgi:hypothetical protein